MRNGRFDLMDVSGFMSTISLLLLVGVLLLELHDTLAVPILLIRRWETNVEDEWEGRGEQPPRRAR